MTGRQVIETPCKVNLYLGIHDERDARGYHRVDSVMVPISLCDTIVVTDAPELSVHHAPALEVVPERTTVWKATTLLAGALGMESRVHIEVTARIPEKAGLGGSSADAGAVLRALAERWGVDALDERVVSVARRVGADVAFFLDPVPSLHLGAGDVLTERFGELALPIALVMPEGEGVSAKGAYDEFDLEPTVPADYDAICEALRAGDAAAVRGLLYNNLAPAAKRLQPGCAEVEAWMAEQPEALTAMVTGSGSCVFAVCQSLGDARALAARAARARGWWSFATLTVGEPQKVC